MHHSKLVYLLKVFIQIYVMHVSVFLHFCICINVCTDALWGSEVVVRFLVLEFQIFVSKYVSSGSQTHDFCKCCNQSLPLKPFLQSQFGVSQLFLFYSYYLFYHYLKCQNICTLFYFNIGVCCKLNQSSKKRIYSLEFYFKYLQNWILAMLLYQYILNI